MISTFRSQREKKTKQQQIQYHDNTCTYPHNHNREIATTSERIELVVWQAEGCKIKQYMCVYVAEKKKIHKNQPQHDCTISAKFQNSIIYSLLLWIVSLLRLNKLFSFYFQ